MEKIEQNLLPKLGFQKRGHGGEEKRDEIEVERVDERK